MVERSTVTLDDIIITDQLIYRSQRHPDWQAENRALHDLARHLGHQPETILRQLVTHALELCDAGTAGISLLETNAAGVQTFRWVAIVGAHAANEGGVLMKEHSPCGACLEIGAPILFDRPGRYFSDFRDAEPAILESLVLPLCLEEHPLGTLWITAHSSDRTFDSEDLRLMTSLADFTALALVQQRTMAANNIQDLRRAEVALNRSEERYRTLLNSIDEGFCIVQVVVDEHDRPIDYKFLEVNHSFEEQTGLHQAAGRSAREMVPGLEQHWIDFYAQVARTGEAARFENSSDAMGRWFDVYACRIGEPEARLVAILFKDISAARQLEAEQERILQREQAARETAERANQLKDEFLAVLSHELRSPLNPILGWTRMLREGQLDTGRAQVALATIERNAKLQAQLIEDLLDISRIVRGKLMLAPAPIDLQPVLAGAIETVRLAADAKAIQLSVEFDDQVSIVQGDRGRLQQVFWNLLSNAVKFTPNGGRASVRLFQHDHCVCIEVSDTGKGIDPAFLPHVFDQFRQEDGAITRRFSGLGLGLSIARQIVELHGGKIEVESAGEARGATFRVLLPLLRDVTAPVHAPRAAQASPFMLQPLADLDVLVVDDEVDSREFIAFVIEEAGARVTAVGSAIAALKLLSKTRFDVLVSDIGMSGVNGYQLMRELRSQASIVSHPIPVSLALTAYASDEDCQRAIAAGFDDHVTKPIEPDALVHSIERLVKARSAWTIGR